MKGRSAYFLFADEHRAGLREELQAAADAAAAAGVEAEGGSGAGGGGGAKKVSVAEVAKVLGARWKALSEEARAEYKQRCDAIGEADRAAAAEAAAAAGGQPGDGDDDGEGDDGLAARDPSPLDVLLPLSNVRRIALADEDVTRVSGDGVAAIAAAVDMLMGVVVRGAVRSAKASKRRTLQLKDFSQAVKQDRRLVMAGMRDVEAAASSAAAAEADAKAAARDAHGDGAGSPGGGDDQAACGGDENREPDNAKTDGSKRAGKGANGKKGELRGVRAIDTFFTRAAAPAPADMEE